MTNISKRKAALIAGFSILTMAILAGFSYGFVLKSLVVPNQIEQTLKNITSSAFLFRTGICSFVLVLICDILTAWALHLFFIDKPLSLLTAWFRLVYSAILGVALLNLVLIVVLVSESSLFLVKSTDQLHVLVNLFLNGFETTFALGLVVFSFHLLFLAYLVYTSISIPKLFGYLLFIASLCYLVSNMAHLLLPNYILYKENIDAIISLPMIVAELGFGIWLLIKGGK